MSFFKNSINVLKSYRWWIIAFIIILPVSQYAFIMKESFFPKIYLILLLAAILVLFALGRFDNPKKLARNAFLVIVTFGLVNALALPVRKNPDENFHFYNAMQIADGQFLLRDSSQLDFLQISPNFLQETQLPSEGEVHAAVNTNLYSQEFRSIKNSPADYGKYPRPITGVLNPVYYPAGLGIALGRLISPYFFVSYYLGRIFNLLMYALLAYFAIKISRRYQLQLFALSLVPYTLWIAAGYSYDSLYYGLILLLLAQMTNILSKEVKLDTKRGIFLAFTGLLLFLCKAPIALLLVIPLFMPVDFYRAKKDRLIYLFSVSVSFVLGGIWTMQWSIISFARKALGITQPVLSTQSLAASPDPVPNRTTYFLAHPLYTIEVFLRNLFNIPATIMDGFGWPQPFLKLPNDLLAFINVLLAVFIFTVVSFKLDFKLTRKLKIAIIVIITVITLGIIYAISGDSRVFKAGDLIVDGIQARYQFYILALLPLLLAGPAKKFLSGAQFLKAEKEYHIEKMVIMAVILLTFLNSCAGMFGYF